MKGVAEIVEQGAVTLGIKLPSEAGSAFEENHKLLKQDSRKANLTAIKGTEDVARLHFLDSLALLTIAQFDNKRVIDIGSGAGFPGVPLKIVKPSIDLTVVEATGKRVDFLNNLCDALRVSVVCENERAEESAVKPEMREKYDIAVSRAVARLNLLCELCIPFVKIGGLFLAMKGMDSDEELDEARDAIHILGTELVATVDYTIPGTVITHRVIAMCKTTETPDEYPRKFAKIKKEPLGPMSAIRRQLFPTVSNSMNGLKCFT